MEPEPHTFRPGHVPVHSPPSPSGSARGEDLDAVSRAAVQSMLYMCSAVWKACMLKLGQIPDPPTEGPGSA